MNAQDLYDQLKSFLNFVGLRFREMGEVTVTCDEHKVTFSYKEVSMTIDHKLPS